MTCHSQGQHRHELGWLMCHKKFAYVLGYAKLFNDSSKCAFIMPSTTYGLDILPYCAEHDCIASSTRLQHIA